MGVQFAGNILIQANGGPLPISQGGTGMITAPSAINALLPVQSGQAGKILVTDGVNVTWSGSAVQPGGADTQIQYNDNGVFAGSSNFVINKSTGAITAASTITNAGVAITKAAGTLRQVQFKTSGSDRWLLQADATAESGANAGSNFELVAIADNGSTQNNVFTVARSTHIVDFKNIPSVNGVQMGMGAGSVTSVAASGTDGVTVSGSPITASGTISVGLGDITPLSVAATGTVTGSNLSGTNTGDQTITLTGDVAGTGTGSFATTLATVNASPQTDTFRKITVNGKGLTTATSAVTSGDIIASLGYTPVNKAGDTMSGALTATQFNGSGAGLTSIPNAALTNTSVTVGTTNIALGATATTLAGLTSVTSTGFIGALTGNATTVTNGVYTTDIGTVTNTMLAGSIANAKLSNSSVTVGTTNIALGASSTTLAGLTSVTSTSFVGELTGNATSATSSTTATNVAGGLAGNVLYQSAAGTTALLTTGTSSQVLVSGATPSWTNAPTLTGTNFNGIPNGALTNSSVTVGSTSIALGASSTTLAGLTSVTSTSFVGALTGNASTVTNGVYTTDTGTVTNAMLAGGIANAKLANSSTTIGTTAIALGASSTTLGGLTSVTSTSFVGALTGNASTATSATTATTATSATTATNIASGAAGNVPYQSGTGATAFVTNAAGVLQAATLGATPAWTTTPALTGTNFTGIPNAALTNSSTTIGATAIALGASSTTLAGLTSVTSTSFVGALTGSISGNAATVTNGVYTTDTGTVTNTMLAGSIANGKLLNSSVTVGTTAIALGASSTTLGGLTSVTSTGFTGALTGNATTATTLATSRNISASGDATWTVSFNGGADATAALTLATVNASPQTDTFRRITVNSKGLTTATSAVTSGDITTALGYTPVNNAGGTMTGLLILSADPTNVLGAATKQYVDNMAAGVNIHASCETSTTAALAACTYNNGASGVGATLTANANGVLGTIGGYATLVVGSRLLVKDQAAQLQNGIYTVTSLGSAGTPWVLTRATDFDGSPTFELSAGDLTYIQEGTLGGSQWVETAIGTGSPGDYIIVGTNSIIFSQFAGSGTYSAGTGINIASGIISNSGVLSLTTNTGLSSNVSATGNVTVTNTGVTSAIAGSNISVSGATGAVTIAVTGTVPTATNATNVGVTNDVATATAVYPVWVTANTGNLPAKVSSTKLSFVPSTGALTTTTFIGALTGNASTATNIAGGAATRVPFQSAASTTTFSTDFTYDDTFKVLSVGSSTADNATYDSTGSITQGATSTSAIVLNSAPGNRIRLWTSSGTGGVRGGDIKLNAGNSDTNTGGIIQLQPGLSTSGASGYVQVVGSIGYLTNGGSLAAGTTAIDFAATGVFNDLTLAGNATLTFANPIPTGYWGEYTFRFAANPTAYTVTWPAAVTWATGTAPFIPTTGSTTIKLVSSDGGTTYIGTVVGNATAVNDTTTNATYYPTLSTTTAGQTLVKVSSTKLSFNPSTGVLAATTFSGAHSGSGAGLTSIPNTALVSSSVTVGSTAIALGATATTLAGLTSVTSTGFTGALTGNASTATALATPRNIGGTSFNGSADIVPQYISDSTFRRITNPGGAYYNTSTATVTGALQVILPVAGTATMIDMTVKVHEYVTGNSFEVHCGGYAYSVGNTWANAPYAYIVGNPASNRSFTVRFGYTAAGKMCVYIGELATAWQYPQFYVTDVQLGYGGMTAAYQTGWATAVEAVAFENVTATVSTVQVGRDLPAVSGANLTNLTAANITGTVANATNTTNVAITNDIATATTVYPTWVTASSGNTPAKVSNTKLSFVPSTGVLTATQFTGSGAGLTAIPNTALTNSSVTVNGTAIALGASGTVTAAAGTLTGATLAAGVTASSLTSVGTITSGTWSGSFGAVSGANLTSITGANVTGTVANATTAVNATNTAITDDVATATTVYPTWASSNTGNLPQKVSSTKLSFVPSTGVLSATTFSGAHSGSGAGLTSIPNSALTNSSVTVGSTAIALGAAATTIAGLTSVTSTTFVGALTGNASTATTAGTVTTAAQPNITSVGTMTGLTLNRTAGTGVGVVYQSSATGIWSVGRGVWSAGNDFEWYDMVNVTKPVWISSTTGALNATSFSGSGAGLTSIPNTALTNSSITVNGTAIALGASGTVTAAAGTLTGATLAAGVTASSLTSVGTLASLAVTGTITTNSLEVGTKILPQVSQSADYTLVLSDSGKHILHPSADTTARTFTIPANSSVAFPIGTSVTFINQNAGGSITIAITTDTMRIAGAGTTGSRTLTANGVATAVKIATTEWIIFGTNLT